MVFLRFPVIGYLGMISSQFWTPQYMLNTLNYKAGTPLPRLCIPRLGILCIMDQMGSHMFHQLLLAQKGIRTPFFLHLVHTEIHTRIREYNQSRQGINHYKASIPRMYLCNSPFDSLLIMDLKVNHTFRPVQHLQKVIHIPFVIHLPHSAIHILILFQDCSWSSQRIYRYKADSHHLDRDIHRLNTVLQLKLIK